MPTLCRDSFVYMNRRELQSVVCWCQKFLNLRDWIIAIHVDDEVPDWLKPSFVEDGRVASCKALVPYFTAWIWISPKRVMKYDDNMASCVCHEMIHILLHHYGVDQHDEQMIVTLENMLYQNWKRRKKLCATMK